MAIVLASTVGSLCAAPIALGSFSGKNGVVAYSSGGIWAVDPVTGKQRQLTFPASAEHTEDLFPSFSPSGGLLAFQRSFAGGRIAGIYLARADGSQVHPLFEGREPSFSPNGRELVFVRADGLYVAAATPGALARRLTDHPGDHAPRWSVTGNIVFERTDMWEIEPTPRSPFFQFPTRKSLAIIAPPDRRVRRIFTMPPGEYGPYQVQFYPDWSPSGSTVSVSVCVVVAYLKAPRRLMRRLEAHARMPMIRFHESCSPGAWAPDGHGLLELNAGALHGRPATTCPEGMNPNGGVGWQPVVKGTPAVSTGTCEPREETVHTATSPSKEATGSKVCFYSRKRHRRVCIQTASWLPPMPKGVGGAGAN